MVGRILEILSKFPDDLPKRTRTVCHIRAHQHEDVKTAAAVAGNSI